MFKKKVQNEVEYQQHEVTLVRIMRKAIIIIFSLFLFGSGQAQSDSLKFGFRFSFPEYNKADITELNDFLSSNGLPTKKYWPNSFHYGAEMHYNRFKGVAALGGLLNQPEKQNDTTFQYSTNFFSINVGYDVLVKKNLHLYPFVGYKLTGLSYDFKVTQPSTSLQGYLQSPNLNRKLTYSRNNMIAGLGFEYGNYFVVGIESGIYVPLNDGSWRAGDNTYKGEIPVIDFDYFIGFHFAFRGITGK